jgi:5-formyltetrahydrofolate cyclo-ligase
MPPTLDEQKRALRDAVKGRCRLPGAELAAASLAAQQRLLASGLLDGAERIALYRALPSEVQTAALELALTARGASLFVPAVEPGACVLAFHGVGRPLRRSALGIDEPIPHEVEPAIPLGSLDAIVLPGLAADSLGRRLGRGRGHYDATLAAAPRALRLLMLFDAGLVPEVPVGEHDVWLDAVCTESRLLLCTPRARAAARPGAATEAY